MSDEQKPKGFLKITWQQVISTVVVALFVGALGWMFATVKNGLAELDEFKEWKVEMETKFEYTVEDMDESIKSNSSRMGAMSGEIRKLELLTGRLEVITERLEQAK